MLWIWMGLALAAPPTFTLEAPPPVEVDPFAWAVTAEPVDVGSDGALTLRLVVPPSHFVYRDRVSIVVLEPGPLSVGAVALPPGQVMADVAGDLPDREQYGADVFFTVPFTATRAAVAGLQSVTLQVEHQGCRPGLCFPPTRTELTTLVPVRASD